MTVDYFSMNAFLKKERLIIKQQAIISLSFFYENVYLMRGMIGTNLSIEALI